MEKLLAIAFAIILAGELALLGVGLVSLVAFACLLWSRSPWMAALAVLVGVAVAVWLWRSHRAPAPAPVQPSQVHPGISISTIPITGAPGALYMLQFLVWLLVTPAVGILYAVLLGGALLVLPLVFFVNRPGRHGLSTVAVWGVVGMLCGLALVAVGSVREFPLAWVFGFGLCAGVIGAPILIWWRGRTRTPSIAPYSEGQR